MDTHQGNMTKILIKLISTLALTSLVCLTRQGGIVPDRFLKVYDVRMLRALSPVPVVGEPFLLRFLPAFSSQLAVVSAMGQLQILDANAPASSALQLFQVNTQGAMCMALEVSSSCQCVAVGDSGGYLHTFGSNSSVIFNSFSRGSEFADPIEPLLSIPMDDFTTPLTSIPSPYPSENSSLSDWPDQFSRRRYRRVPPVDPLILNNMRMVGTIGYAPNPADRRPNQVSYSTEKRVQRGSKHSTSDQSHLKGSCHTRLLQYYTEILKGPINFFCNVQKPQIVLITSFDVRSTNRERRRKQIVETIPPHWNAVH